MGFSLLFMALDSDAVADADREGLRRFLDARGLRAPTGPRADELTDTDGRSLMFDGYFTDLHIDPLDRPEPLTGGIDHATLSAAECAFVFELCVAAGWLIVNPQGGPGIVVPAGNHSGERLPAEEDDGIAFVDTGEELQEALSGDFERFVAYRNHVLGRTPPAPTS